MVATFTILVLAHWVGVALLIFGYVLSVNQGAISNIMVWGARVQLLLGLALVGAAEMGGKVEGLNHLWIASKLVIALVVVGLCEVARTKATRGANNPKLMHVAAGLVLVNVILANLWRP